MDYWLAYFLESSITADNPLSVNASLSGFNTDLGAVFTVAFPLKCMM